MNEAPLAIHAGNPKLISPWLAVQPDQLLRYLEDILSSLRANPHGHIVCLSGDGEQGPRQVQGGHIS